MTPTLFPALAYVDEVEAALMAVAIVAAASVLVAAILVPARTIVRVRSEREQTKREIAAYTAEGSIAADDAVRMIEACERGESASPTRSA